VLWSPHRSDNHRNLRYGCCGQIINGYCLINSKYLRRHLSPTGVRTGHFAALFSSHRLCTVWQTFYTAMEYDNTRLLLSFFSF